MYYLCDTGREYLVSNIIKKIKKKRGVCPAFLFALNLQNIVNIYIKRRYLVIGKTRGRLFD